jgi:trans-aconitate 2-methyltransferase
LGAMLREAYPPQPYGTVLPFRRIFAVAQAATGWSC